MFPESDLLPISALQHLLYCDRQCALIHVEQLWAENSFTVHGKHLHERADSGKSESRHGVRTVRSLPLRSFKWGLVGKADIVEFRAASLPRDTGAVEQLTGEGTNTRGDLNPAGTGHRRSETPNPAAPGNPFPVEYKRGKPKAHDADLVQLCAQALCLEEMLGTPVLAGALFYGKTRRRLDVAFDEPLRNLTQRTIAGLHELIASRMTPPAVYEKGKCGRCSLINLCMPKVGSRSSRAADYLDRALTHTLANGAASD
jgi:CRISPR-associated exonuclease Cas4